jgi:hypothetical protein
VSGLKLSKDKADSFSSLLQGTKNMFTPIYKIYFSATELIFLGRAEDFCQEWTTLAKEKNFNSFLNNKAQKQFSTQRTLIINIEEIIACKSNFLKTHWK